MSVQEAPVSKACVLGGGAFGTAAALVLAKKGAQVNVWDLGEEQSKKVNADKENKAFFPGFPIPDNVTWHHEVAPAVAGAEIILVVIPSQFLRGFFKGNSAVIPLGVPIVLCAKGIEISTLMTPYEICEDILTPEHMKNVCVLSGPSFAKEVAQGQPTNVVVASHDAELVKKVQGQMCCQKANFRTYSSDDFMGCEIAGAVKNVLAVASGCSTGLGFGNNTRAALICRGLSEMARLAKAMGSNTRAMPGLAGCGDLLLTCSSDLSRNFSVGQRLAKGESPESVLNQKGGPVAEGVATAKSIHFLAQKKGVEMPICEMVYQVIYENKPVMEALKELQARPMTVDVETFKGEAA